MDPFKGFDQVLRAAARLRDRGRRASTSASPARRTASTRDAEASSSTSPTSSGSAPSNVGWADDLDEVYEHARVVALASKPKGENGAPGEGAPLVLMEAMGAGAARRRHRPAGHRRGDRGLRLARRTRPTPTTSPRRSGPTCRTPRSRPEPEPRAARASSERMTLDRTVADLSAISTHAWRRTRDTVTAHSGTARRPARAPPAAHPRAAQRRLEEPVEVRRYIDAIRRARWLIAAIVGPAHRRRRRRLGQRPEPLRGRRRASSSRSTRAAFESVDVSVVTARAEHDRPAADDLQRARRGRAQAAGRDRRLAGRERRVQRRPRGEPDLRHRARGRPATSAAGSPTRSRRRSWTSRPQVERRQIEAARANLLEEQTRLRSTDAARTPSCRRSSSACPSSASSSPPPAPTSASPSAPRRRRSAPRPSRSATACSPSSSACSSASSSRSAATSSSRASPASASSAA